MEHQTLRRFSGSRGILFTIKIHHDPLKALEMQIERSAFARDRREQLIALDEYQLAYKGLTDIRDLLASALQRFPD